MATNKLIIQNSSGNVGIGTTNPGDSLHIHGGNAIRIKNSSTYARLDLGTVNNQYYVQVEDSAFDGLGFYQAAPAGGAGWKFFLDTNGNVGIGTTSPSERLDVTGGKFRLSSGTNGYGWIYGQDTNHSIIMRGNRDGTAGDYTHYYQYGSSSQGHHFWTGGALASQTERFRITNDYASFITGNVGIGTTNPQGKLTISNAGAEGIEFFTTGGVGSGPYFNAYNRSAGRYVPFTYYANTHTFYVNTGSTRAIDIDSSGNVGIGTASPSYKLHTVGHTYSTQGYSSGAVLTYTAPAATYNVGTWYTFTARDTIANLGLSDGMYIFRIFEDTYAAGGGNYFINYLTEPFWFYSVGSNANNRQEFRISPIRMGHAANQSANYVKIAMLEEFGGVPHKFQWSPVGANLTLDGTGGKTVTILMYKFGGI